MKKALLIIVLFFAPVVCFAGEHFGRISAGYYNTFGVAAGYSFSDNFSLGVEASAWSDFCGLIGGVDARYRFSDWTVKPFADVMVGYGMLGKTLEYEDYYDFAFRAMPGVSWKRFDLGVGVAYDSFYKLYPVATLSFNFSFCKKK